MSGRLRVFIAGAGPAACAFARILVEEGKAEVVMADVGPQCSPRPGDHLKNSAKYQNDVDDFAKVVQGHLNELSVPPGGDVTTSLDPVAFQLGADQASTRNALNPRQDARRNLPGAVAGYAVGGMGCIWTCVIPRQHPTLERATFISSEDWGELYTKAEELLNLHTDVYRDSVRHRVLKRYLTEHGRAVQDTPVASERSQENPAFIRYTGADTILGSLADPGNNRSLTILPEHCVSRLEQSRNGVIRAARVRNLRTKAELEFEADVFVVAAGGVHTAQILWNSYSRPDALGCYLSDHTFAFCQVVLKKEIVEAMGREVPRPTPKSILPDPIPIPMDDPSPHLYIPVTPERPWHSQIHREAFQFNPVPRDIDSRLIVDLRWFGMIQPRASNRVTFEPDICDKFGMPQPTFHFELGSEDGERQHAMMGDMEDVAHLLGGYLPTSRPTFLDLGSSTHLMGATRIGANNDGTSVADSHSKVWDFDNLYVGGNCVIPTANAANPTLTTIALAVRAARSLLAPR